MSLITKSLLNNFCFKRVPLKLCMYNKLEPTCANYYTVMNKSNGQSKDELYSLPKCQMFLLSNANYLSLKIKLNEMLKDRLFSSNRQYLGFLWFKSLDSVNVTEFFSLLQMSDTFYSRFKIVSLYVWMLLFHLPQGSRFNNFVRYGLIEAMWDDTQKRAKVVDSYNLNYRKNMKSLYAQFKTSLVMYDLGFFKNDMALSSSLWYVFFDGKDVDPRLLEVLVFFVRDQMNHLQKLDIVMLTENKTEKSGVWIPLEPYYTKIFNTS